MKKVFLGIIIIVILAVVIVAGYYFIKKQFTLDGRPGDQVTNTTGWKTYTNNNFGFEVKYPSDWTAEVVENGDVEIHSNAGGFNVTYRNFYNPSLGRNWTIEELIQNTVTGNNVVRTQIQLDNLSAIKATYNSGLQKIIGVFAQKPNDTKIYWIDMEPTGGVDSEIILNEMLSTLKFTK